MVLVALCTVLVAGTVAWQITHIRLDFRPVEKLIIASMAKPVLVALSQPHTRRPGENGLAEDVESPDHQLRAVIKQRGQTGESQISILARDGSQIRAYDFSSVDGDHGYGVDGAHWTPDSQYFVVRMRSSGGHSPLFAPIVFWSRKANQFYSLKGYTGDITFVVLAPDRVRASTWPDMRDATVSLHGLKSTDITELP